MQVPLQNPLHGCRQGVLFCLRQMVVLVATILARSLQAPCARSTAMRTASRRLVLSAQALPARSKAVP